MRIALVLKAFETHRGGAQRWTYEFAQWLIGLGHDVHVVTTRVSPDVQELGLHVKLVSARRSWDFAQQAETWLRQQAFDVIHDMGSGWYCDVFHSHVGSPLSHYEACVAVQPWPQRWAKRLAWRSLPSYSARRRFWARQLHPSPGRRFIALSQTIERDLSARHGIPHDQIHWIPNGVNLDAFTPCPDGATRRKLRQQLGVSSQTQLLLLLATRPELKGVETLLAAAGRLNRSGRPTRVVVLGATSRARLRRSVQRHGMTAEFHILPFQDPRPYFWAADAYVHPSHYDAYGLSVLEAMASGLPVVTSNRTGVSEQLDRSAGYVLDDPRDVGALTESLLRLREPACQQRMRRAARQQAEQLGQDRAFAKILALYDDITASRSSRDSLWLESGTWHRHWHSVPLPQKATVDSTSASSTNSR